MSSPNALTLTADEIDDVLYFTRVNEVDDLKTTIAELAQKYNCQPKDVVEAAVDPESGNSTLHYCAANGLAGKEKLHPNLISQSAEAFTNHSTTQQTSSPSSPNTSPPPPPSTDKTPKAARPCTGPRSTATWPS